MARYLLVRIEDDSKRHDGPFALVRKTIHDLSKKEGFALADFGTDIALVTRAERTEVEALFERVMARARNLQKVIDENP